MCWIAATFGFQVAKPLTRGIEVDSSQTPVSPKAEDLAVGYILQDRQQLGRGFRISHGTSVFERLKHLVGNSPCRSTNVL